MFDMGRFEEALAAFEAATALAPADADAWCSRAGALRELGRLEESLEAAQRALALRPDFPEAAINLGNALLKLDRMEEALDAYRRAADARPASPKPMRRGSGVAQSRSLRRSARRVRGRRGAGQPGSCRRQGLPPAHPRRFRARLGGLRGALASRQVARRGARHAISDLARAFPAGRARARAQRPWARRHDPVRPLSAADGRRRRRDHLRLSAEIAPASLVRTAARVSSIRRRTSGSTRRSRSAACLGPSKPVSTTSRPTRPI